MATPTAEQSALAQGTNFVWHELYTTDYAGATNFYSTCLGFGAQDMEMGEHGVYKMLTRNGTPICGMMEVGQLQMDGVPPHWAVYLGVENLDATAAKCADHGATIVVPRVDVPGVGGMVLIRDPQGAHIWLFEPTK